MIMAEIPGGTSGNYPNNTTQAYIYRGVAVCAIFDGFDDHNLTKAFY
ncbi:hypothetical protein Bhyg_03047 [Pseudolycoriella hygida]|uniref:Uncharacterized protein n=1 Tax=Pseudolycoriella hygida TaxID=35572 RepID=A0A9Q0NEE3_9DIPT|nr:hypothetical protein Bhyg_03047 [Pseudolycoriella hygida]